MLKIEYIREILYYSYESKLLHLSCDSFGEEVTLIFDEDSTKANIYKFKDCYEINISHIKDYPKERLYSESEPLQIPFRLNNWKIQIEEEFILLNLVIFPLNVDIHCKDIAFARVPKEKLKISV